MAGSPDTLARFLINQVLSTLPAGSSEDNLLSLKAVVGDDGLILLVGLDESGPLLAAGDELGLGALRGVTGALGAADVLAVDALLGRAKVGIALVAGSANAHADGLVYAQDRVVGGRRLPFARLDLQTESLPELLGSLLKQLRLGKPRDALHSLIASSGLLGLGRDLGLTRDEVQHISASITTQFKEISSWKKERKAWAFGE